MASFRALDGVVIAVIDGVGKAMLERMEPLQSGRDTEIDMIEREMEGGVVVIQPLDVHEHYTNANDGGLFGVEGDIDVHELGPKRWGVPKA